MRLAVLAAVLLLVPALAAAAGLGRMTVLSGLGQPLNAEIELSATKDELATMQVRVAAPESFRKANIEFTPLVASLRLGIEQRRDGRMVIRVASARPVNDPFLQVLIELSWASGRLVREYTSLIDPPATVAEVAPPVLPPVAQPVPVPAEALPAPVPAVPEPARPVVRAAPEPRPEAEPAKRAPRVKAPVDPLPAPAAPAAGAASYGPVRGGETLAAIAGKVRPQGVSLDQMLVAMFRQNPEAFASGNMNRLRSGAILRVPDAQTAGATPANEATREVRAQATDWNQYRQRLAGAVQDAPPPGGAQPGQAAAGKITPRVEDKAVPAQPPREVVKLSKGDVPAGVVPKDAKAAAAAREEDATARAKALREANDRILQLEKMLKDAQSLLAVQSRQLAELQKQVQAVAKPAPPAPAVPAKPEPVPVAKAPEPPPKPAPPPVPAEPAKAVPAPPPEPPKPAEPVKPAEPPKAEEPVKPVEPPQPAEPPKAVEAPKPKPAPPPPPPAPSFFESLLRTVQEYALLLGVALLAVLGLAWYAVRRRRPQTAQQAMEPAAVATVPTDTGQFANAADVGGPIVEPVSTPPVRRRDEEELDPLQEAELYLVHGRDAQAEAVLKEAIAKWPKRHELQVKLLELYAKRSDLSAFEAVATELFAQTGGQGPHWQLAAEMGYALDPENPLYESGKSLEPEELRTTTMMAAPATVAGAAAVAAGVAGAAGLAALAARGAEPDADATVAIGSRAGAAPAPDMTSTQVLPVAETLAASHAPLDLDMTSPQALPPVSSEGTVTGELPDLVFDQPVVGGSTSSLDMDFTFDAGAGQQVSPEPSAPDISLDAGAGGAIASTMTPDLVLDVPDGTAGTTATPDLTLDLDAPDGAPTAFTPDFTVDIGAPADPDATVLAPSSAVATDVRALAPARDANVIDFDLDTGPTGLLSESPVAASTTDFQDTFVLGTLKEEARSNSLEDTLVLGTAKEPKTGDFEDTFVLASAKELAPFDPTASGGMPMESSQITLPRIDLDMGGIVTETSAGGGEVRDERWNDVATKLDLAKAYEEMGDKEGAREILQEVLQEGDDKQRAEAQSMLAKLG